MIADPHRAQGCDRSARQAEILGILRVELRRSARRRVRIRSAAALALPALAGIALLVLAARVRPPVLTPLAPSAANESASIAGIAILRDRPAPPGVLVPRHAQPTARIDDGELLLWLHRAGRADGIVRVGNTVTLGAEFAPQSDAEPGARSDRPPAHTS